MGNTGMVKSGGGGTEIAREGFGERSLERRNETASTAVAAAARAEVEAAFIVARTHPRDWDDVRGRLLKSCTRTSFAERAFFSLPRRGTEKPGRITGAEGRVEGLSVRFAEAAIRDGGNMRQMSRTIYDDDAKRIISVACIDLESNATYSKDIVIEKTVERRFLKQGQTPLGERVNSYGDKVFLVPATDDEILQKEGALISKTFRTLGLRLVPADILEECERQIATTVAAEVASDPDAAKKRVLDGFATVGVKPSDLKAYLGHDVDSSSPAELIELKGLYSAVRDGEVSWTEALAEKTAKAGPAEGAAPTSVQAKVKARAEKIAEAEKKKAEKKAEKKATKEKPAAAPPKAEEQGPAKETPSTKCAGCKEEVDFSRDGQVVNGVTWHPKCLAEAQKAEQAMGGREPGED